MRRAREVIAMQEMVGTVYCSREVRSYVATIAAHTRQNPALQLGVSPRAIALLRGSGLRGAGRARLYTA